MRKGQKFTPTKIRNWRKLGRGTGFLSAYEPWHQVTRGDPSSRGRSQLAQWAHTSRSHHFLSDGESDVFAFITMLPNIEDVREQVPLSLHEHAPELAAYSILYSQEPMPGTLACAKQLNIRHPKVRKNSDVESWVMTTDFLVTFKIAHGKYELLAISVKPDSDLNSPRVRQLLQLEKAYWNAQGIEWLLISPSLYQKNVRLTVRMALPWGLPKQAQDAVPLAHVVSCANQASEFQGKALTECLYLICSALQVSLEYAQRTFWQAVWKGLLRLDLARSSWPSDPIIILDPDRFREQNPIAARRSICI